MPPYVVFGDVALRQMAALYPQDETEFSDIHGVGRVKLEEYGPTFMKTIRDYVEANNIILHRTRRHTEGNLGRGTVNDSNALSPTYEKTKELLEQGLSLDEVAEMRGLARTTIIGHIERIDARGFFVDVSYMAPREDRLEEIQKAFLENGSTLLSPVKERLGEGFEFDDLRLARVLLNQRARLKKNEP